MPKPAENEFDIHAYRKFLMSHFPSNYLHNKIISENENQNQKDSALTSKKNRRKRPYPFASDEPSSKRRKENLVNDNDTNADDDMYKYANIITTRSGKQIKVPIRVKSKESDPKMKLNHELEMKSPKGGGKTAPLPGGKGVSNTVSSNTNSKPISKKESSFRMKDSNRLSRKGKFLKKTFHRPPPPKDSSSGEDDDDIDNDDNDNDIDETETGSSNSYTSDNSMSDKKIALKQRKQTSNDLKKLLANKMNIIITMDHPSKAKAAASKKK